MSPDQKIHRQTALAFKTHVEPIPGQKDVIIFENQNSDSQGPESIDVILIITPEVTKTVVVPLTDAPVK
ncbi:hypothetical protein A3D78_07560 [Candidatus Gottesmanbacteria bacterium RIFCSPHIGHO2_02_FULL_39_14]|uniref:Uncharacterized protein n=1 Tax=Candidatus Gottesmanbacteria bacterium RIFCSPHIGHO2_02_FULL_39_14 TaxID=1798383 RepID=A0A1F6A3A3_9BACT|nr:MAG: hypothetical protein A3D78_07560 [Candidatus Gottesmanbacteria bacterium RIFCSPHIGHO2_02_FULL_39_14]